MAITMAITEYSNSVDHQSTTPISQSETSPTNGSRNGDTVDATGEQKDAYAGSDAACGTETANSDTTQDGGETDSKQVVNVDNFGATGIEDAGADVSNTAVGVSPITDHVASESAEDAPSVLVKETAKKDNFDGNRNEDTDASQDVNKESDSTTQTSVEGANKDAHDFDSVSATKSENFPNVLDTTCDDGVANNVDNVVSETSKNDSDALKETEVQSENEKNVDETTAASVAETHKDAANDDVAASDENKNLSSVCEDPSPSDEIASLIKEIGEWDLAPKLIEKSVKDLTAMTGVWEVLRGRSECHDSIMAALGIPYFKRCVVKKANTSSVVFPLNNDEDRPFVRMMSLLPMGRKKDGKIFVDGVPFDYEDGDTGSWSTRACVVDGRIVQRRVHKTLGTMFDVRATFETDPEEQLSVPGPYHCFKWGLVDKNGNTHVAHRWFRQTSVTPE
eukprot:Selendium_serpulae@DN6032_c0_g1_i2.p1